jgi:LPS-assembly lipoprotein
MWWRSALPVLAAAVLAAALAGCGFRPLYGDPAGEAAGVPADFSEIRVGVIPDRSGQILRNYLIRTLNPSGRPVEPRYRLAVTLTETSQDLGIRADDTATRANLIFTAAYRLTATADEAVLVAGQSTAITSYNILIDEFATLTSETDARERALRELSDQIRLRLGLYFTRAAEAEAAAAVRPEPGPAPLTR